MTPTYSSQSVGYHKRQKYAFPINRYIEPEKQQNWDKILTILFPEPRFHDLIEAHGIEGYVAYDWSIKFRPLDDLPLSNGPRYSRLCKALWDEFGPLFDEFGIQLLNRYTNEFVPIKKL